MNAENSMISVAVDKVSGSVSERIDSLGCYVAVDVPVAGLGLQCFVAGLDDHGFVVDQTIGC